MRVGRLALGLLAAGWLAASAAAGWGAVTVPVAASAGALWLVAVLLAFAVWDLFVSVELAPPQRMPSWLGTVLVPVAFLAGLILGRLF